MGEIQVIPNPVALPGQCVFCGSATKDWYLDPGLSYEFYGSVIICCECLEGICDKVGYMSPDRATDLKEANKRLARRVQELEQSEMALHQAINALKVGGYTSDKDGSGSADLSSHPSFGELSSSEVPSEVFPEREGILDEGESRSSEQSNESGLADLSDGSGDESELDFSF